MKVLILSDHLSIHTIRWARSLAERGVELLVFSLSKGGTQDYDDIPNIQVMAGKVERSGFRSFGYVQKLTYLKALGQLNKAIREFQPDLLHAHYATSYGLLSALTGFHPYIISVWGSDVYDFPDNFPKRAILRYNLSRADVLLSTSRVMAEETNKYTDKKIEITPFGIDTNRFSPGKEERPFAEDDLVFGTVKSLEAKYGVDYLLKAFSLLKKELPEHPLKLLIVGQGTREKELKDLARQLNLENDVLFTGWVDHADVPKYMRMLDIYVALSVLDSESFGVAILEASSTGKPVIVSRVGGLPEVVEEGVTGFVVKKRSEEDAASAMKKLAEDPLLRTKMGEAGRKRVLELYDWNVSVDLMMAVYDTIMKQKKA